MSQCCSAFGMCENSTDLPLTIYQMEIRLMSIRGNRVELILKEVVDSIAGEQYASSIPTAWWIRNVNWGITSQFNFELERINWGGDGIIFQLIRDESRRITMRVGSTVGEVLKLQSMAPSLVINFICWDTLGIHVTSVTGLTVSDSVISFCTSDRLGVYLVVQVLLNLVYSSHHTVVFFIKGFY
jgi:hypothetical protein